MSSPLAVKPKAKPNSPKLAKSAMAVKGAGRMGDTELVHVNKDELNQMRQQWGEPTINPETGQPEFFLGFLKKLIAPVVSLIPGVGPAIGGALGIGSTAGSALLGAGLGALGGGGAAGAAQGALGSLSANANLGGAPNNQNAVAAANAPPSGTQNIVAGDTPPTGGTPMPKQPNFWNRNFLGIKGLPNKYGIPLTALAVGALAGGGGNDGGDSGPPTQDQINQNLLPVFKSSGRQPTGFNTNLSPVSSGGARAPIEAYYRAGSQPEQAYFNYVQHLATGGQPNPAMAVKPSDNDGDESPLAVKGPGDGRSDSIPAKLSDGEYVMDAESVSMLGNGSNRAGANKLDSLRVNLRKQKGKSLARGKISPNAKEPARYIARKA